MLMAAIVGLVCLVAGIVAGFLLGVSYAAGRIFGKGGAHF